MVCEKIKQVKKIKEKGVLILVLMEDGLRVEEGKSLERKGTLVLILVLMEDGLRVRIDIE